MIQGETMKPEREALRQILKQARRRAEVLAVTDDRLKTRASMDLRLLAETHVEDIEQVLRGWARDLL